ncbi:DUF1801 domain-containing protein [Herbiconiux sp. CPCC 205763]|uniref:DUF1801 domain-containing protein n=1 Tax=Herbiconiux aconitum TaxID=2970913 RepID=A0ABT2GKQ3_9MICO|nr:DUF1801 domain-containing protein [Herbiconiux aconitum]MCS5716801.1 DUF1801 domain-containing protein [Herbiconiux aconitum]
MTPQPTPAPAPQPSPAPTPQSSPAPAPHPSSSTPPTAVPPEFADYVSALAPDRAALIGQVVALVESALPAGYERAIEYGMPAWVIPLADYPQTYNGHPLAVVALAAQKNYTSLYLNCVQLGEAGESSFRDAWAGTGKKLDMGKSCVRFRRYDDLAAEVIAEAIRAASPEVVIAAHERARKTPISG